MARLWSAFNHFPVLLSAGLLAGGVVLTVVLQAPAVMFGWGVIQAGSLGWHWSREFQKLKPADDYKIEYNTDSLLKKNERPPAAAFCEDCSKPFISSRRLKRYNSQTGKPVFAYYRHCPDAHVVSAEWPTCGKQIDPATTPGLHNHDDDEVKTTCPVCIDGMVKDGALPVAAAAALYAKAGAVVPPKRDPDLFGLYGGAGRLSSTLASSILGKSYKP
jgi:hypothetical protein